MVLITMMLHTHDRTMVDHNRLPAVAALFARTCMNANHVWKMSMVNPDTYLGSWIELSKQQLQLPLLIMTNQVHLVQ